MKKLQSFEMHGSKEQILSYKVNHSHVQQASCSSNVPSSPCMSKAEPNVCSTKSSNLEKAKNRKKTVIVGRNFLLMDRSLQEA